MGQSKVGGRRKMCLLCCLSFFGTRAVLAELVSDLTCLFLLLRCIRNSAEAVYTASTLVLGQLATSELSRRENRLMLHIVPWYVNACSATIRTTSASITCTATFNEPTRNSKDIINQRTGQTIVTISVDSVVQCGRPTPEREGYTLLYLSIVFRRFQCLNCK